MADTEVNPPVNPPNRESAKPIPQEPIGIDDADRRCAGRDHRPGARRHGQRRPASQTPVGQRTGSRARGRSGRIRPGGVGGSIAADGPVRVSPPVPEHERGQESQPGLRTGKVIGVRGKSIFVDLGGKSEGVLPVDQFEGDIARSRARPSR